MKTIIFTIPLLMIFLTSCTTIYKGNLSEALPKKVSTIQDRGYRIVIDKVSDLRPKKYQGKKQHTQKLALPLLLYYHFEDAGPVFEMDQNIDVQLQASLNSVVKQTLKASGMAASSGRTYALAIEIINLYSVNYTKNSMLFMSGSGSNMSCNFYPTGHMALRLRLHDLAKKDKYCYRVISSSHLYNPKHEMAKDVKTIQKARVVTAQVAVRETLTKLPMFLDSMVADLSGNGTQTTSAPKTFKIVRMTREYDFQEEVEVDYKTGTIVDAKIVKRKNPVVSAPNVWYLSRIRDGRWLGNTAYESLVSMIGKKYTVSQKINMNVALFKGIK